MKNFMFDKADYRESKLHDGWKYRKQGTSVVGINNECNMKILLFNSYKECNAEFQRLTGKPVGRPKERQRHTTNKGDMI